MLFDWFHVATYMYIVREHVPEVTLLVPQSDLVSRLKYQLDLRIQLSTTGGGGQEGAFTPLGS